MNQSEIEHLTAQLLLKTENPLRFPTHLKKVAKELHASIVKSDLKGESGYILHYKGEYLICIDSDHHRVTHNRFSIAHELSHIALGHLNHRAYLSHYQKEWEANYMAGAILMPFHFMVAYRSYDTRILSSFMAVSEEAMGVRRKNIARDPAYRRAIEGGYYQDHLIRDFRDSL